MTNILVPKNRTSNKQELASYMAYLFTNEMLAVGGKEGIANLKSLNNSQLRQLHDIAVREYEFLIVNYIKKSLRLCYGGTRLFGLTSIEMNNYLTDVRLEIQKFTI